MNFKEEIKFIEGICKSCGNPCKYLEGEYEICDECYFTSCEGCAYDNNNYECMMQIIPEEMLDKLIMEGYLPNCKNKKVCISTS